MTRDQLEACNKKTLIELARQHRVVGWHGMRKADLVKALEKQLAASKQPAASKPE